jgi:hypothetical protein
VKVSGVVEEKIFMSTSLLVLTSLFRVILFVVCDSMKP